MKIKMANIYEHPAFNRTMDKKFLIYGIFIVTLVLTSIISLLKFVDLSAGKSAAVTVISQSAFEQKFGLQVSLIGVTAAGGQIDFRMKILDPEKAKSLLVEANNFPQLISAAGIILNVPTDSKPSSFEYRQNGNIILLFSNSGGAIIPGMAVRVRFGGIELEPVISK
jgi:hypothetical protein